jgi:hypothetical protein
MASVVESTVRALSEVEQGSAQGLLDNRNGTTTSSEDLVVNEDELEQVFQVAPQGRPKSIRMKPVGTLRLLLRPYSRRGGNGRSDALGAPPVLLSETLGNSGVHLDLWHPDIECRTHDIERNIRYRSLRYRMHIDIEDFYI